MASIYRYENTTFRGSCPECEEWDGTEGTLEELPPVPNPLCFNHSGCNCQHVFVRDDDDDDDEPGTECCCYDSFFHAYYFSPSCNCSQENRGDYEDCDAFGGENDWIEQFWTEYEANGCVAFETWGEICADEDLSVFCCDPLET